MINGSTSYFIAPSENWNTYPGRVFFRSQANHPMFMLYEYSQYPIPESIMFTVFAWHLIIRDKFSDIVLVEESCVNAENW